MQKIARPDAGGGGGAMVPLLPPLTSELLPPQKDYLNALVA